LQLENYQFTGIGVYLSYENVPMSLGIFRDGTKGH